MGDTFPWIIFLMFVLMIIFGVIVAYLFSKNKKGQRTPDYYAFFIMGLIWFIAGLIINNTPLWIIGLLFLLIGLLNHGKWRQNEFKWKNLSKGEKRLRIWIMVFLLVILFAGLFFLFLVKQGILY
jgi:cell division protein FtsW (lipid II flippase)